MKQEIWHGDCLELMKNIPDGSIDMVLTSPPYDNLRTYNGSLKWGEHIWKPVIKELFRLTKDGGAVVWVVGDATINGSETGTSFKQALYFKEVGFNIHDTMIWNKGSFANPSKNRCHQVFEYMFIFTKKTVKTFNEILDRKNKYLGIRGASGRNKDGTRKTGTSEVKREFGQRFNIWDISIGGGSSYKGKCSHPAVFPEKLAHDHIITWSNEGDIILDPFAGSGTTGKVARQLNRQFILIEREREYYNICIERLNNFNKL
jgi:DNA modification methylase